MCSVEKKKCLGWKNNAGSFWTMVAKTASTDTHGRYTEDIMQISAADKVILEEIGYGNINAIEQQTSLSKEGYWEAITSLDGYCQIREAGRPFEKLKSVIEAYHPDLSSFSIGKNVTMYSRVWTLSGRSVLQGQATGCIYLARLLYQGDMDFPSPALFLFRNQHRRDGRELG